MTGTSLTPSSVLQAFLLLSSIKWLLLPTYRSTDFDVHRNWLAVTRHLPILEWYFDDVNGTTVHTLDYPPLFAFFEAALSNNALTASLLESGWLDERCLALLADADVAPTSERCVRFQRATVVASDVLLFWGAYLAARATGMGREGQCGRAPWFTFMLIVTNPGLIILDHVHFQYNGMLLGILLISIASMVRGAAPRQTPRWELLGAAAFATLLAAKHLYLILAPLYFCYLLRRHCFLAQTNRGDVSAMFSLQRLLVLAVVTATCLAGPFVPFLLLEDPGGQLRQISKRLFPFGRGLVHDYWAANAWALYMFASRLALFVFHNAPIPTSVRGLLEPFFPFPEPPPSFVAVCLLAGLWPAIVLAWRMTPGSARVNECDPGKFFIHAVVFSSLSGFMLGYHVHEKAIMTAIVPLTLLATSSRRAARLYLRMCLFGIFGLLPLLFRAEELLFKVVVYVGWMCGAVYGLEQMRFDDQGSGQRTVLTKMDLFSSVVLALLLLFMECIHPILFMPQGKLEFLPLMATSVTCAMGLGWCWMESYGQMHSSVKEKTA